MALHTPHRFSGRWPTCKCWNKAIGEDSYNDRRRLGAAWQNPSVIVAWLSISPYLIEISIEATLTSFCQKDWKFSASFCNKTGPPALKTLAGMDKYDQATLPVKRESITSSESPILLEALITIWWSLLEAFKHKYGFKMDRKGRS